MQGQKCYTIYLFKTFAIFMVVYVHSLNIYNYCALSVPKILVPLSALAETGAPLFMIISGFLFFRKEVDWKANVNKKTKRLLIPFLIWSVFWVIFETVASMIFSNNRLVIGTDILSIIDAVFGIPFGHEPLYTPLWYIRELFILSIFAPLIQKPLRRWPCAFFLIGVMLWFLPIGFVLKKTVVAFVIGGVLSVKRGCLERLNSVDCRYCILLLLVSGTISYVRNDIFFSASIVLNLVSVYLIGNRIVQNSSLKYVSEKLSNHIFFIFVTHGKLLSLMQMAYVSVLSNQIWVCFGYFFIPVICVLICIYVSFVFRKLFPKAYYISTGISIGKDCLITSFKEPPQPV